MATRHLASGPVWTAMIAARMPRATTQRVRANRRMRRAGAVAVRPGVYALPDSSEARDALSLAAREVGRGRGAALPCLVAWLDPADEERLRARFEAAHARRRERLLRHIAALERALASRSRLAAASRRTAHARLARLRRRLDDATTAVTSDSMASALAPTRAVPAPGAASYRARTWVTRKGVLVDRIASAWFILRFLDRDARFLFVVPGEAIPANALRFDMAEAEFGHEDDRCTFETLVARFRADDPALRHVAEIVHDLDLRDRRYGRPEAAGVAHVIAGLAATEPDDVARIRLGQWLFDCLHASLRPGTTPRLPKGVLP